MGISKDDLKLEPLIDLIPRMYNAPTGDIYLQGDYPWNAYSLGLLFYSDGYNSNPLQTKFPEFMAFNDLQHVTKIWRGEDALRNAFIQKPDVSTEELIACFNFHCKHDGFLDLEEYNNSKS